MTRRQHQDLQDQLAAWLRVKHKSPPMVFTEISVAGKNAERGRFDVLAIWTTRNYSSQMLHGFEVKVSRADLLGDLRSGKWEKYLDQVNRFYFVFPEGLATKDEIPKAAGVIIKLRSGGWRHLRRSPAREVTPDHSTPWRLLWRAHDALDTERQARRTAEKRNR